MTDNTLKVPDCTPEKSAVVESETAGHVATELNDVLLADDESLAPEAEITDADEDDIPDIPVGPWSFLEFPRRHALRLTGIMVKSAGKKGSWSTITAAPLWISRILSNVSTGVNSLQIAWQTRTGEIRFHDLTEEQRSDKRAFSALAGDVDAPLYMGQITQTMDYLQRLYRLNEPKMPRVYIANRLGWSSFDNRSQFVLASSETVQLSPGSANLSHYAAGFRAVGCLGGWIDGTRWTLERCPGLAFLLLASLSSPLLTVLGAPSFTAEIWGKTSSGKTSSLNVIASIWGKVGTGSAGLVGSWDNTAYYVEQLLAFNNSVPAFLMDCHKAKPEVLEQVSYQLANGFGKGRGMKSGGMRTRATWNCVLISDGEKSLYSAFQNDGAKARVLSWYGSPLEDLNATEVRKVVSAATDNHGQLAPAFIEALAVLDHETLRNSYNTYCDEFSTASQSGLESRSAQYFAAMKVALDVVSMVPGMEWFKTVGEAALMVARQKTIAELHEGTAARSALAVVAEWVSANRYHFEASTKTEPIQNIYGHVMREGEFYAFYTEPLQKALAAAGYTYDAVVREWKERGFLVRDRSGSNNGKVVRIADKSVRLLCIKTEALFPPEEATVTVQLQVQ